MKNFSARCMIGDPGSGAGKGGGSGGSIRDAGGAYGKMEAAREDEYFHKLVTSRRCCRLILKFQKQAQLKGLKQQLLREAEHHEEQAKHHQDVIERHKKRIKELEEEEKSK
jgi:hypothetical protein